MKESKYKTFEQFFPFYLSQHENIINRRLHIIGTLLAAINVIWAILFLSPMNLIYGIIIGYGFSWTGHFFFEKNKPAAFKYPIYSFFGDLKMCGQTIIGKRKF